MSDRFKDTTFICYHSLVSGVITECRLGYQQPTITRGHEEDRERGGKGGERLLMSVKRRNGGSGAEAACVCVCLEKEIRILREESCFCGRSETITTRNLTKKNLFKVQSWWGRYRPQDPAVKSRTITLWVVWSAWFPR